MLFVYFSGPRPYQDAVENLPEAAGGGSHKRESTGRPHPAVREDGTIDYDGMYIFVFSCNFNLMS